MTSEMHSTTNQSHSEGSARQYPRYLFSVPFSLRYLMTDGFRDTRGITLDISESGMGASVQGDVSPGGTVRINLAMPGGPLSVDAIVRYHAGSQSGFEFLGLTPRDRERIANVCRAVRPQLSSLLAV